MDGSEADCSGDPAAARHIPESTLFQEFGMGLANHKTLQIARRFQRAPGGIYVAIRSIPISEALITLRWAIVRRLAGSHRGSLFRWSECRAGLHLPQLTDPALQRLAELFDLR